MNKEVNEKRCYKCKEAKPLEEFHNDRRCYADGKKGICKPCRSKQYYENNTEYLKQYSKQYYENNAERKMNWQRQYRKRIMSEGTACVYGLYLKEDIKYIGETLCLERRKKEHHRHLDAPRSHRNKKLQEEFDKHNLFKDDVTFKILVEFNKDEYESEELLKEALLVEEAVQIAAHKERGVDLYNSNDGGPGGEL
tara:strand:- start:224 stop:808 length:585 start_codon:yes stop_codon:yes gene_type:complete